jgi:hypothetical protein
VERRTIPHVRATKEACQGMFHLLKNIRFHLLWLIISLKSIKKEKKRSVTEAQRPNLLTTLAATENVPGIMFRTSYEIMTMKYGFDPLDISNLASLHMNRAARQLFLGDPSQLSQVLVKRRVSYFSYLPSRYGHSTCLNDAVDCLVSRVRQIVSPDGALWTNTVLSLYVRALNSLQSAIQCSKTCLEAEVLCATGILALYEVRELSIVSI